MRLDVRLENETVWLTQSQMGELFGCSTDNVGQHLKNIYASEELSRKATTEDFSVVRMEGRRRIRRTVTCYNLDAIISVGYRVNSVLGVKFRQWATSVLKEHLLRGYTINARLNQIEDRVDRRLAKHNARLTALEDKVDFFVQTQTPPLQGVFYDGQLWDACSLVEKLVGRAKKSILLVDSWVGPGTLDLLAKKRKGVKVRIVASAKGNKLAPSDVDKFSAQYGSLSVRENNAFHDRFLVLDDKELYLVGASLKDLGKKCFAFAKMDEAEIPRIIARIRD